MTNAVTNLHDRWGLGDREIARALDVERNRICPWLREVSLSADEVARADLLDEFCDDLHELGYEPGVFLPASLVEGYTVTGWDVHCGGRSELLLAFARGECTAEQMLNAFAPDWRRTYWTSMKTVPAADGGLSIVEKSYDDVLAQIPATER